MYVYIYVCVNNMENYKLNWMIISRVRSQKTCFLNFTYSNV